MSEKRTFRPQSHLNGFSVRYVVYTHSNLRAAMFAKQSGGASGAKEAPLRKRKAEQDLRTERKQRTRVRRKDQDDIKKELSTLDYTNDKMLEAFIREHGSASTSLGSEGEMFTPWKGWLSDRARFRLWECGNVYIKPPEKLKVIGYLGHVEEDIVIMVGTQSGKVYMDEDEIVYIVADSLSDFAQHGCKKSPQFFDYWKARPNDVNSLACAAGTFEDKPTDDMTMDTAEEWTVIDHGPEKLEADIERADRLYKEMGGFLSVPKKSKASGSSGTCKVRAYETRDSPVAVF